MTQTKQTALITGASSGIGRAYADRFGARGYKLILVGRDPARLTTLSNDLAVKYASTADTLAVDLTKESDLQRVEQRLESEGELDVLVNNAGMAAPGSFVNGDKSSTDSVVKLNVLAVTRLTTAAVAGFLRRGSGSIINVASVVALAPEVPMGVYGATKAFVLSLSQALNAELGQKGIYAQAVLPPAVRTEIWERSGRDVNALKAVMEVDDLVDAAMVGFDRKEQVSIPGLPDERQWEAHVETRRAMLPHLMQARPAERYRSN